MIVLKKTYWISLEFDDNLLEEVLSQCLVLEEVFSTL